MDIQIETPQFIPFKQIPSWSPDEVFEITGTQLQAIQDLFKAYTPFVKALEPVFVAGLNSGKITIKYEDLNGNPLAKERIDEMLQQYAEALAQGASKEE